jgi:hypothetical protein
MSPWEPHGDIYLFQSFLKGSGHGRNVIEAECCFDFQKDDRHIAHIRCESEKLPVAS